MKTMCITFFIAFSATIDVKKPIFDLALDMNGTFIATCEVSKKIHPNIFFISFFFLLFADFSFLETLLSCTLKY